MLLMLSMASVVVMADEQSADLSPSKDELEKTQLAREERKRQALEKKVRMESCLTLVRAFYGDQEKMVSEFISTHPTQNKSRLMSKCLASMMIKCNNEIN